MHRTSILAFLILFSHWRTLSLIIPKIFEKQKTEFSSFLAQRKLDYLCVVSYIFGPLFFGRILALNFHSLLVYLSIYMSPFSTSKIYIYACLKAFCSRIFFFFFPFRSVGVGSRITNTCTKEFAGNFIDLIWSLCGGSY